MSTDRLAVFTRAEVAKHNKLEDLWIIVGDSVYNMTSFVFEHPGGESAFMDHAGKDGTKAYRVVYNHEYKENVDMLAGMKVGTVRETNGVDELQEEEMLHASVGHSTVSGPPHVLLMMAFTAVCGLAVHYWSSLTV